MMKRKWVFAGIAFKLNWFHVGEELIHCYVLIFGSSHLEFIFDRERLLNNYVFSLSFSYIYQM